VLFTRRFGVIGATALALVVGVTATPFAAYANTSSVVPTSNTVESQDCRDPLHTGFTSNLRYMFDGDVITVNFSNCNTNYAYGYSSPYPTYAINYGNVYANVASSDGGPTGPVAPVAGANYSVPAYDRNCVKVSPTAADPVDWSGISPNIPQITSTMTSEVTAEYGTYIYDKGTLCGGVSGWDGKQIVYKFLPVEPQVTSAFGAPTALLNAPVSLVITVSNTQVFRSGTYGTFTGLGFTLALPAGATGDASGASTTCRGGSVTTPSGNTQIQLSGASLGGAGHSTEASCTVTVPVTFTTEGAKALTSASLIAGATNRGNIYNNTADFNKVAANVTVSSAIISPATQDLSGNAGAAITPTTPFTPQGLTAPITYSISPALPDGLSINPQSGVVSGTPKNQQDALTYTITASDGSKSATAQVTITIAAGGGGENSGLPEHRYVVRNCGHHPRIGACFSTSSPSLSSADVVSSASLAVNQIRSQHACVQLDAMLTRMEEQRTSPAHTVAAASF
jgi:hypothetical protein